MIEHATPSPPEDQGPPVLLKRAGNGVEANLIRMKLESAGIPCFLGPMDVLGNDLAKPYVNRTVEVFVPQRFVQEALDVLDTPVDEHESTANEAEIGPAGLTVSFRALVAAVVGWVICFIAMYGIVIAPFAFVYSIILSIRAIRQSSNEGARYRAEAGIGLLLSLVGMVFSIGFCWVLFFQE